MIFWFSSNHLVEKKKATKKIVKKAIKKPKKNITKKVAKKKTDTGPDNSGIVIIDDDLTDDKETADEERLAYLEEARSQEASSD